MRGRGETEMGRNGETARKKDSIEHGEKGRGQRVGGRRIASLEVGGKGRKISNFGLRISNFIFSLVLANLGLRVED